MSWSWFHNPQLLANTTDHSIVIKLLSLSTLRIGGHGGG